MALARSLMPKTDDKKKDDDIVAPIPAKEKDRLARRTFVSRVQMIYTKCMESEMSKGNIHSAQDARHGSAAFTH